MLTDTVTLIFPKTIELLNITPNTEEKNRAFGACIAAALKPCDRKNLFLEIIDFSSDFQIIWTSIVNNVNALTVNNINEIITELKNVDTVISHSSLGTDEKSLAFQVNSIARFSSAYWVTEKLNPNSEWIGISNLRGGDYAECDPPDWVYTDIESALIGFWFAGGPFSALGCAGACSAYKAAKDAYNKKNS